MKSLSSLLSLSLGGGGGGGGGVVLPSSLGCGFLLGVLHFLLFLRFLGCRYLACCLGLVGIIGSTLAFLFQGINFSCHCHNLFLFIGGLAPSVLFIQQPCFILGFCTDHEVLCCVRSSSIVTLALEIFNVHDEFFIWCCFIGLPEVVEEVNCLLFPGMKAAYLFLYPLIKFSDVALQ